MCSSFGFSGMSISQKRLRAIIFSSTRAPRQWNDDCRPQHQRHIGEGPRPPALSTAGSLGSQRKTKGDLRDGSGRPQQWKTPQLSTLSWRIRRLPPGVLWQDSDVPNRLSSAAPKHSATEKCRHNVSCMRWPTALGSPTYPSASLSFSARLAKSFWKISLPEMRVVFSNAHRVVRLPQGEKPSTQAKTNVHLKKVLLHYFWDSKRMRCNKSCFHKRRQSRSCLRHSAPETRWSCTGKASETTSCAPPSR